MKLLDMILALRQAWTGHCAIVPLAQAPTPPSKNKKNITTING